MHHSALLLPSYTLILLSTFDSLAASLALFLRWSMTHWRPLTVHSLARKHRLVLLELAADYLLERRFKRLWGCWRVAAAATRREREARPLVSKIPVSLTERRPVAATVVEAASTFDDAHTALSARAGRSLDQLARHGGASCSDAQQLAMTLIEIRSHRFAVQPLRLSKDPMALSPRHAALPEYSLAATDEAASDRLLNDRPVGSKAGGPWRAVAKAEPERRVKIDEPVVERLPTAWQLESSLWVGRRAWADSRAFYESDEFVRKCFAADWEMAKAGGGLGRFVMRFHTASSDCNAVMQMVANVIAGDISDLYHVYDAYAMSGSGDFTHIQLNDFRSFILDCELMTSGAEGPCCPARWDELFIAINASAAKDDQYNHKKGLNRQEFFNLLVRAAVMRFMMPQIGSSDSSPPPLTDASVAIKALLSEQMLPRLRAAIPAWQLEDINDFRKRHLYTEATTEVFGRHLAALRAIYDQYAYGDGKSGNELSSTKRLSIDEWRRLLDHLALIDSEFGDRQATAAFVLSRNRVVHEADTKGRARLLQLCFEDWLEALVRIALVKALPTKQTVREAGCLDGGHYILQLQAPDANGAPAWAAFLRQPRVEQSAEEASDHLVTLIIRSVQSALGRPIDASNLELTIADVKAFARLGGRSGAAAAARSGGSAAAVADG